ncbi:gamma-glutamyltransferase family protein [Paraconexibacter antarcticus]|uniref:Gamma-glutamyltransferase family protein n=1 Tax=Paraconexibacter antarcticus TaxID=2949664 RepID=A0ABY5E052_9ACTN|nr:gamma-glutamyltransferase [Paraconexibacter antarcticus]UTI66472.1 gamma-glutamyltransferase family protein [Paraconexibacter antarcticus]
MSPQGTGGVVAAGHPLSAQAGVAVLRDGGNAVDAALAAMLTSMVAEPLLTGLGAGGYMLTAGFDAAPALLDFFVAAPGAVEVVPGTPDAPSPAAAADLLPVTVDFGDATQVFHVGAGSVGTWGMPAGIAEAAARWGSVPLRDLVAPAAAHARAGVPLNGPQAYIFAILEGILLSSPEGAAVFAPGGRALREGESFAWPDLADGMELLAAEGAAPFYRGAVADAVVAFLATRGGALTALDLRTYLAVDRVPSRVGYRGRTVLTNPPPNAGGVLLAAALADLGRGPVTPTRLVAAMEGAQAARTDAFVTGLAEEGFAERFLAGRIGSTTHVSVLDGDGRACSVTVTNGEGSGVVVPGTGMHPNNMMGEEDLNPLGFHVFPAGRRMPSMMAPTVVLGADGVELVAGSAGSSRIRSALLQVVASVLDDGHDAQAAVDAPRLHFEDGLVYAEPGAPVDGLREAGRRVVPFRERNLFFGGVQAVVRRRTADGSGHAVSVGGDPRRGGAGASA